MPTPEKHFNGLSPQDAEILALIAEECAEVIQAVTKIQRHGLESRNPLDPEAGDNRRFLAKEVGHLRHALKRAWGAGILNDELADEFEDAKAKTIGRWLHHADA
ncbi:MAG TPA: hypothetical protein VK681_39140 [Reyranella sp.]|nr:hypothetical protein [Reyranella sp.]